MFSTLIIPLSFILQQVTPVHTYNGLHNGIVVEVDLPDGEDVGQLVLVDFEQQRVSKPISLTRGTHDLTRRIPEISKLQSAVLLHLLVQGEQVGTPLVVQPMLSREVPVVEDALRPDGKTTYTKIIGWQNEAEEDGVEGPFLSGWRVYVNKDAVIETSLGNIRVSLRPDVAPNTVWNFRELASGDFYDNTNFHRIVPLTSKGNPFVIQGGDPTGSGMGGPGYWLPIERSTLAHDFGVISMARAGDPDSAGCQFFLCLSRAGTARLDDQYCAFGETIAGAEVIRAIAALPLHDPAAGKPVVPPTISTIKLIDPGSINASEPIN
jgi:peptidyl-prolyl cis-trans isomerase B (cyclophilin B)